MAVTVLDPHPALVVVDLQQGLMAYPTAHPIEGVVGQAAKLAAAFRRVGAPVTLVRSDPSERPVGRTELGHPMAQVPEGFMDLVPDLEPGPDDVVVTRGGWSALAGTGLGDRWRSLGVTQLVVCGIATSFGVESTARAAYDEGFSVVLVVDAMTDPRAQAHLDTVERVFPVLGETAMTEEVLALLGSW